MSYVVTAPYITVRVKDDVGSEVVKGFYEGGVLPDDVNTDDLERHVRKGMVAEKGSPEADAASPVGKPVQFDSAGMPRANVPDSAKPKPGPKPGTSTKA